MSSSDRTMSPIPQPTAGQPAVRPAQARSDEVSIEAASLLRNALARSPEIRPEVVARARALVTDPSYPPLAVVRLLAQQILSSPDLSEDQS